MAILTIEDRTGEIEVLVFPQALAANGAYLTLNTAAAVQGTVSAREDEEAKILLRSAEPLVENSAYRAPAARPQSPTVSQKSNLAQDTSATQKAPSKLFLKVESMDSAECRRVQSFLQIFTGSVPVVFYDASTGKYMQSEGVSVTPTPFVLRELEEILGENAVVVR